MSAGGLNFNAVPLGLLRRYLKANRWQEAVATAQAGAEVRGPAARLIEARRTDKSQRPYTIFRGEADAEGVELIVPIARDAHEYALLVSRVVSARSALEERDEKDVVESIRHIGFDIVQSSIPDTYVVNDTIHLEKAESFIKGIRSVLAATATTEIDPQPYFRRVLKEGNQYANNCRFGHTFRGSFGFTIESPLEPHDQVDMPDVEPSPPFERRVIQRLVKGLLALDQAAKTDDAGKIVETADTGLNANICEQLSGLVEQTAHAKMRFKFLYSPEWVPEVSAEAKNEFVIEPVHVEVMKAAAREMRKTPEAVPATVRGKVVKLASSVNPSNLQNMTGEREVEILWSSEEHGDISVRTSLIPADYLKAVDAHRAGRPVGLEGSLEQKGRKWTLSDPKMLPSLSNGDEKSRA